MIGVLRHTLEYFTYTTAYTQHYGDHPQDAEDQVSSSLTVLFAVLKRVSLCPVTSFILKISPVCFSGIITNVVSWRG